MKFIRKSKLKVENLNHNDTFTLDEYPNDIFMKVRDPLSGKFPIINLKLGTIVTINPSTEVNKVECEICEI